jgi:hypothetical protein
LKNSTKIFNFTDRKTDFPTANTENALSVCRPHTSGHLSVFS